MEIMHHQIERSTLDDLSIQGIHNEKDMFISHSELGSNFRQIHFKRKLFIPTVIKHIYTKLNIMIIIMKTDLIFRA